MEARACPQAAAHPRCPARPRGTGPVAEPRGDGSGTDSSVSPRLHARRAAAATGSRPDAAGRADTQDWLGQTPGPAQTPGPGLSQHLFILPFPQPTLFLFLLSSRRAAPGFWLRDARGGSSKPEKLHFLSLSWQREGGKAGASLIGINTVTSYLLLPNEETRGCCGHRTGRLLLPALGRDLRVHLELVISIGFPASLEGAVIFTPSAPTADPISCFADVPKYH